VGLLFVGLVVIHLAQRRRTIARLSTQIIRARTLIEKRIRVAGSDLALVVYLSVHAWRRRKRIRRSTIR
jgi:hypothetical protein